MSILAPTAPQRSTPQSADVVTWLYQQHSAPVYRYALHLTGRREDAEDVVQHVFIQAYRALERGTELANPRAWLMKSARHRAFNVVRDRREIPVDGVKLEAPVVDADPAETEALAAVRAQLWTLPEPQHHAFVLRHWSGLSQAEIADVLQTTTSAVESLLIRARAALAAGQEDASGDCRSVRRSLIDGRPLAAGQASHVDHCRRCRTARSRLAGAAELASALSLVPGLHVARSLMAAVPGFGAPASTAGAAASAAAAGGTGSAAAGAGGTLGASAPVMAKAGLAAKTLTAVLATTAVVAAATPAVRQPIVHSVLGHSPPVRAALAGHARSGLAVSHPVRSLPGRDGGRATALPGASGREHGRPAAPGANGRSVGKRAHAGAHHAARGKPANPGAQGKAVGKPAAPGGNAKAAGNPAAPGGNGRGKAHRPGAPPAHATGKPATPGKNGAHSGAGKSHPAAQHSSRGSGTPSA